MNKRILQIAKQAGFYISNNKIYIPTTSEEITTCQTRFAELIVLECADTIKSNHWAKDSQAFSKGMNYSAELIKNIFGVEE